MIVFVDGARINQGQWGQERRGRPGWPPNPPKAVAPSLMGEIICATRLSGLCAAAASSWCITWGMMTTRHQNQLVFILDTMNAGIDSLAPYPHELRNECLMMLAVQTHSCMIEDLGS